MLAFISNGKNYYILLGRGKSNIREAMVFPVVIYGCESWTVKKAEC